MAIRRHHSDRGQSQQRRGDQNPDGQELADTIKSAISGAVSSALLPVLRSFNQVNRDTPPASCSKSNDTVAATGSTSEDDDFVQPRPRKMSKPTKLPSSFLQKLGKSSYERRVMQKKPTPSIVIYDRDIICLTRKFVNNENGTVTIPRSGSNLEFLCRNGLKGKIRLTSDMNEEEIMDEIRSVFRSVFQDTTSFDILQPSGGKLKTLVIPALSSSFVWTSAVVAGSSKSPVYILADLDKHLERKQTAEFATKEKPPESDDESDDDPSKLPPLFPTTRSRSIRISDGSNDGAGTSRFTTKSKIGECSSKFEQSSGSSEYAAKYLEIINVDTSDSMSTCPSTPPPLPPPLLPPLGPADTPNDLSIGCILTEHRSKVLPSDHDKTFHIVVRRRCIFNDTLHVLRSMNVDLSSHLTVTFVGEPAVDDGGPMREYLRLLVADIISNNSVFHGDFTARYLCRNVVELGKRTYYYIGQMLALSLINGGPQPSFFAEPIVDYILYGIEKVKVGIEDVIDETMRKKLTKLSDVNSIDDWTELMQSDEFSFWHEYGVSKVIKSIDEKDEIISSLCLHSVLLMAKSELDELVDGLNTLGVLSMVRSNPALSRQLFIHQDETLTATDLYNLFQFELSPDMSNQRETEESQLFNWATFLQIVESSQGSIEVVSPYDNETHRISLSLSDVLVFATGASGIPPIGFCPNPSIEFKETTYLTTNTCGNILYLQKEKMDPDRFYYLAAFSIANAPGFGQI